MNILLAEDETDARDLLAVLLEEEGHTIFPAANGAEAWKIFANDSASFPLVISDWLMPEMDGLEFCRRVRRVKRATYCYILLLTALQGKSNFLEAMKAGVDDFITKPYDIEELKARLYVAERIVKLQAHVTHLEGILRMCMYCKRIREEDRWVGIEDYVTARTEALFSHGVCPDCYQTKMRPQL